MRAVRYRDRLLEAVEHEVVPFPGALRPPSELADFLADREAWNIIHTQRRRNIAEHRRQLFLRRALTTVATAKDAVLWVWRKVGAQHHMK
jgi:hypothetical protein